MSVERKEEEQQTQMISSRGIAYWTMFPKQIFPTCLTLNPEPAFKPGSYEDMQSEFSPLLFSSMESYLTPFLKNFVCDSIKFGQMRRVMHEYLPEGELTRVGSSDVERKEMIRETELDGSSLGESCNNHHLVTSGSFFRDKCTIFTEVQGHKRYRQKIISNYQPLHGELYTMHAANFFVPSFLKAVNQNTEESFRSIMREPSQGVFTFEMLQPRFCELLMSEVENFERWVHETKFRIMRPNTMNKYGVVLDDFGLENMLKKLMEDFIRPISTVFFPEVGGSTLDSHHGFVVEYGKQRDLKLGFHVDDSEVTLNVCLGKQFSGGELFLRGVRCEDHVNAESQSEEIFDYSHVPGHAVLHRGRHRHGARPTKSGHRINLLLWCRSSLFRELNRYQSDLSSWCGECQRVKKEAHEDQLLMKRSLLKTKLKPMKRGGGIVKEATL